MGQNPQWCLDASTQQTDKTFSLCNNPGKTVNRNELSSW